MALTIWVISVSTLGKDGRVIAADVVGVVVMVSDHVKELKHDIGWVNIFTGSMVPVWL